MSVKGLEARMKPSVCGVGYLGCNLELKASYNGKKCPIYYAWVRMFERCYSKKFHRINPTYIGCTVSDEFKDYSKWREWYDNYQYKYDGWHMDKDLLFKGNKVYSESTCVFLPKEINAVLTKATKSRGKYLVGVSYNKFNKKFHSSVSKYGKNTTLGYYVNEYDAHLAYKQAKEAYLKELADKYKDMLDPRAYKALYNYTVDIDD